VNRDSDIRHRGRVGFSTESRLASHVFELGTSLYGPPLPKAINLPLGVSGADISAILPKYRQHWIHEPKKKSIS
jgi:hypothetical protein